MLGRGGVIGALSVVALCIASGVRAQQAKGGAAPVAPGARSTTPSGSSAPAGSATTPLPPGSVAAPEGSAAAPVGSTTAPAGSTAAPAGSTAIPEAMPAAPAVASEVASPIPLPVAPAPSSTGTAAPAAARAGESATKDHGASGAAVDTRLQPTTTLGPELLGGGGFRLDGGPDGFAQHTPGDFNFGLGIWAALNRENSFGLVYQRIGLGSARTVPTGSSMSAAYDLNVIWAALRLYPLRSEHARLFAGLQIGLGWQDIQADGVNLSGDVVVAKPFVCSASSGPTFSVSPTTGVDIDVDRHIAFVAELGAGAHAVSGDVVDGCAPGAGSALTLAGRVGLAYRFDADRWFGEQAGNRASAGRYTEARAP